MILQSLYDYYQRKVDDPESGLPPFGFEWKNIPFIIEISPEGRLVQIEDTREGVGRKKQARSYLVPQAAKKPRELRPICSGTMPNMYSVFHAKESQARKSRI